MNSRFLRGAVLVSAVVTVLGLVAWWSLCAPGTRDAAALKAPPAVPHQPRSLTRRGPALRPPMDEPMVEVVVEAHTVAVPGLGHVRCPHDDVFRPDALLGRTAPGGPDAAAVLLIERVGADLLGSVGVPEGSTVLLDQHYQPVARMRWSGAEPGAWGDCWVEALQSVTMHGRLVWSDGSPAQGQQVVTCPGEIRVADSQGRFDWTMSEGISCWPMGFLETPEGGFARGRPREVIGGQSGEILVTMPEPEALWSPDEQRAMLQRLATMLLDAEDQRSDPLAGVGGLDQVTPEAREQNGTWAAQVEAAEQARYEELEFLAGPDADAAELVDAWLLGVGM